MTMDADAQQQRAKRYEAIHNWIFLGETLLSAGLLLWFLLSGGSRFLGYGAGAWTPHPWLQVVIYAVVVIVAGKIIFLPLSFLTDFVLEHRYGLSNQTFFGWMWDETKSFFLSLVLGVLVLSVVYWLLREAGTWWWVATGAFVFFFGIVMSTIFPVVILPLFYKLEPLANDSLRDRLTGLAQRVGAKVIGVYRMGMSEKTKKANAAFAGLGRTKRIILGDTLLDEFSEDEIEVVMAHEMAHYQHRDIARLLAWGSFTTFVGLKIADIVLVHFVKRLGYNEISDIATFPLLALCMMGFGLITLPLNNAFTRWREWKADRAALELTGNPDGFIRAMKKLAEQNLADLSPHPVIEYLLHDHPSLARRIQFAEKWQRST
jgi:STE24 endopeptidase